MGYVERAMAAYWRSAKDDGLLIQPANTSSVQEYDGKEYVVLRNVNGILAVYRITNAGQLKRLKRWPTELENY
jgi:hypothetical protein